MRENPWLTVTFAVSEDKISGLEHGDIGRRRRAPRPVEQPRGLRRGPAVMVEDTVSRLVQQRRARPTDFQRGLRPQPTGAQC